MAQSRPAKVIAGVGMATGGILAIVLGVLHLYAFSEVLENVFGWFAWPISYWLVPAAMLGPGVALLVSLFVSVVGFYGAWEGWGWEWWQAVLLCFPLPIVTAIVTRRSRAHDEAALKALQERFGPPPEFDGDEGLERLAACIQRTIDAEASGGAPRALAKDPPDTILVPTMIDDPFGPEAKAQIEALEQARARRLEELAEATQLAKSNPTALTERQRQLILQLRLFGPPPEIDRGEGLERLAACIQRTIDAEAPPPRKELHPPGKHAGPDLSDERTIPGSVLQIDGKPVQLRAVDPAAIATDPATFQFKRGDAWGVNERLQHVTQWDRMSAGSVVVFERLDGTQVIADGHQRLALARRIDPSQTDGQALQLDAFVFREADGWSVNDVRVIAARKNLQEMSGSPLEMAAVMRERPEIINGSLPLAEGELRQAVALSRLSPGAFDLVAAGTIRPDIAAVLANTVTEESRHVGLLHELAQLDPENPQQAGLILEQMLDASAVKGKAP